jgi:hypothetical protein
MKKLLCDLVYILTFKNICLGWCKIETSCKCGGNCKCAKTI